jgi:hypothetical protein
MSSSARWEFSEGNDSTLLKGIGGACAFTLPSWTEFLVLVVKNSGFLNLKVREVCAPLQLEHQLLT